MKKPEKIKTVDPMRQAPSDKAYNQACDEWELYHNATKLTKEEVVDIIYNLKDDRGQFPPDSTLAQAIIDAQEKKESEEEIFKILSDKLKEDAMVKRGEWIIKNMHYW